MKTVVEQADLRVRRTHKLLWEALMAELSERPFEEITVKEICQRAMVHRTTFYKHYEDKYALLEQGMRQMYDTMVAAELHVPPGEFSMAHPPPYFLHLFEHVAQHRQFYKLMLCGEGIGRFQKLAKEYIADVVATKMRERPQVNQHLTLPLALHVQFLAGGVFSLLSWWLENDMPLSPHQLAQYLLSVHNSSAYHA